MYDCLSHHIFQTFNFMIHRTRETQNYLTDTGVTGDCAQDELELAVPDLANDSLQNDVICNF